MEVRTDPWPSRRGNGPHPVGWPVQRTHSLACEAAAPVCFGQGFASLASGAPWNRYHPLKRKTRDGVARSRLDLRNQECGRTC